MVDDATFEVDGGYGEDGNQTRGFLILEGDFVEEFERYINDENASSVKLQIPRSVAGKLVVELMDAIGEDYSRKV